MARKNSPYFRSRNAEWAYELKPTAGNPFAFYVPGTNLYIQTFSTRQADIQLRWDYSRSDYNLFRKLKRRFWDDHLYFKKLFETLK